VLHKSLCQVSGSTHTSTLDCCHARLLTMQLCCVDVAAESAPCLEADLWLNDTGVTREWPQAKPLRVSLGAGPFNGSHSGPCP
jgi:hypothetical protein